MNADALQIYSFLMREEIQFIRYCHAPYQNYADWEAILKKFKQSAKIPRVTVYTQKEKSSYLLYFHSKDTVAPTKKNGWHITRFSETDAETMQLSKLLRCRMRMISPLCLFFDAEQYVQIAIDTTLYQETMLCLSPCSNQSSVLITPKVLIEQFLPAVKHPVLAL